MGSSRQKSPPSALQSLFTLIRVSLSLRDLNAKTLDDDALFTLSFEMISASGRVQCTQIRSSFSPGERKDDVHQNRLKSSSSGNKTKFRFSNRRDVFFAKKKRNDGTSSSNNTKTVIVSASSSSNNSNRSSVLRTSGGEEQNSNHSVRALQRVLR